MGYYKKRYRSKKYYRKKYQRKKYYYRKRQYRTRKYHAKRYYRRRYRYIGRKIYGEDGQSWVSRNGKYGYVKGSDPDPNNYEIIKTKQYANGGYKWYKKLKPIPLDKDEQKQIVEPKAIPTVTQILAQALR